MSIRNVRASALLKLGASLLALFAAIALVFAINRGGDSGSGDLDKYFLRDAATVQAMNLPVYWLGRGFTAGALTFQGPDGVEFGGEVEGGGVFMRYTSWLGGTPGEGTNTGLEITVYSRGAWELVKDRLLNPLSPPPGDVKPTRRTVTVKGRQAELISVPAGTRPVNALSLILDLDAVVVVAVAASGGPVTPGGPDYSPFINNPDLLVQVMRDLRPYPQ
jgi:hypothetical protein